MDDARGCSLVRSRGMQRRAPCLDRSCALDAKGVDVSSLAFETSYGRSSMEYYDGFVFGFYAQNGQNGLSAIASGGRYDALTKQLGKGVTMPAVGGVIRPDLVVALRGAA